MQSVMDACAFTTKQEVFNSSLTFFEAALREIAGGKVVTSFDEGTGRYTPLEVPLWPETGLSDDSPNVTTLRVNVSTEQRDVLLPIQKVCGASGPEELAAIAYEYFDKGIKEITENDRIIAVVDKDLGSYSPVSMPAFENAARNRAAMRRTEKPSGSTNG